jgi:hypothetical protein
MVSSEPYQYLLVFVLSISSGLVGCLILISANFTSLAQRIRGIKQIAAFSMFLSALTSCALCLSVYLPMLYMRLNGLSILTYILMYVTLYHVFFLLTRTEPSEKFSMWNYIIPIVLCAIIQITQMNIPGNVQVQLFEHYGESVVVEIYWRHYPGFVFLFMMKPVIIYVVDIYYAVMAIMRVHRVYKSLQLRDGVTRKNKIWAASMIVIVLASAGVFLTVSRQVVAQLDIVLLFVIIVVNNIIDGTFIYYLLSDNYKSYSLYDYGTAKHHPADGKTTRLTVHQFEHYMNHHKQRYMDKQSRISDIYSDLNISASEFTQFIEEHYHQMPGVWLRRWRRIQEIEQLAEASRE